MGEEGERAARGHRWEPSQQPARPRAVSWSDEEHTEEVDLPDPPETNLGGYRDYLTLALISVNVAAVATVTWMIWPH